MRMMYQVSKAILVSALFLALFSVGVNVASAATLAVSANGKYVHLEGEIDPRAEIAFARLLQQHPHLYGVSLSSPGGSVTSALVIAEMIHHRKLGTFIAADNQCASACAIVFLAGHDRLVKGKLGVHQMRDGGRGDIAGVQNVFAKILTSFEKFDVPSFVTKWMLETPADRMHWFHEHWLEQLSRDLPGDATEFHFPRPNKDVSPRDFPALEYASGSPVYPDFGGRDSAYSNYRTRIRDAVSNGPNYAGHFALIEIGCGTSCRFAYVVDTKTGEVASFPYGGEAQYQMKLEYSIDSRFVLVEWLDQTVYFSCLEIRGYRSPNCEHVRPDCVKQALVLEGRDFRVLWEQRRSLPSTEHFCS